MEGNQTKAKENVENSASEMDTNKDANSIPEHVEKAKIQATTQRNSETQTAIADLSDKLASKVDKNDASTAEKPVISPPKEDKFVNIVGSFGKWQFGVLVMLMLIRVPTGFKQMAILFLTPSTTFWCVEYDGIPGASENSTCYDNCLRYEYDNGLFDNTIISEFDLICENAWLASFTQTVLMLGVLFGSLVFGFLADRFGRKYPLLGTIILINAFGFGTPFSPTYWVFTIQRFFSGVGTGGILVVSFVMFVEIVGPKHREFIGSVFQLPFLIGQLCLPAFAYFLRSWNMYSLSYMVPCVPLLVYFFILPESPRWLVSVGRIDEATEIATKIAETNKRPTTKIRETLEEISHEIVNSRLGQPKVNYVDLVRTPALRTKTFISCFIWFVCGLVYFGVSQYISQTSSNPFISVAVAGLAQVPGTFLAIWLNRRFGRQTIISTLFILGGVLLIILAFTPDIFWLNLALGSLGVVCAGNVAITIYIYASELFPTVVRNMGVGVSSMCMRVGSMLAPFVANLAYAPWLPGLIFGGAGVVAGLLCLMLPETKNNKLPDSIEDVEKRG